jgi:hypothetical protein
MPHCGHTGMRERAQMYGGTLDIGPQPGGGFAVKAALPIPLSTFWLEACPTPRSPRPS